MTLINKNPGITMEGQMQDEAGRVLITTLKKGEETFHVANIYGPNTAEEPFWEEVAGRLDKLPQDNLLILAEDLNQVMDNTIDRHPQRNSHLSHPPKLLQNICTRFNLKDPWRLQHPDARDYTFYSNPHNSYSRIDYILMSSSHTHLIEHTDIGPRTISDHSCISLQLSGKHNDNRAKRWRFNRDVLRHEANKTRIEEAIKEYLVHNGTQDTETLWEALKATTRGTVIDNKANINKQANKHLTQLEHEIKTLENSHTINLNDRNTLTELSKKKYEYNRILSERAGLWINKIKAINLCQAHKAGRILASHLKHKQRQKPIASITDPHRATHTSINSNYKMNQ